MNKNILTSLVVALVVLSAFALGLVAVRVGPVSLGSALEGGATIKQASTTQFALSAGAASIQVAATTTCATRIVTTGVGGVGLSFNAQLLDANSIGHWQAASTTVSYDGALYGCGVMRARVPVTTTIIVTEQF